MCPHTAVYAVRSVWVLILHIGMQDNSFDVVATPLTEGQRISEKMAMFRDMERHSVSVPKPQSQAVKDPHFPLSFKGDMSLMSRGGGGGAGGATSRSGAATERSHHVADASANADSYMPAWAESIALAKIDADDVLSVETDEEESNEIGAC
jgi:hypothetical protein